MLEYSYIYTFYRIYRFDVKKAIFRFFFVRSAHRGFVPLWNMADSGCGKKDQVIFKKDDELFLKGRRLF